MKKIIFIISVFITSLSYSQTIQVISADFTIRNTIFVCYDTANRIEIGCDISKNVDSISIGIEYTNLLKLCNNLTGWDTLTAFALQLTPKQSFCDNSRLLVRNNNFQLIFNIEQLSSAYRKIISDFIIKIKTII